MQDACRHPRTCNSVQYDLYSPKRPLASSTAEVVVASSITYPTRQRVPRYVPIAIPQPRGTPSSTYMSTLCTVQFGRFALNIGQVNSYLYEWTRPVDPAAAMLFLIIGKKSSSDSTHLVAFAE